MPVVVASVTASAVGRAILGDVPAFAIPEYTINSLWEFPMYLLLGVLAAIVGVIYTKAIYGAEDLFASVSRIPDWIKPAIGGVLLGGMALLYGSIPALAFDGVPQVYGVGYETISAGLMGQQMAHVMLALMCLKIVSTSLTLGSGGSGGVFAPGLFIGSMLGGSFGLAMHAAFPGIPAPAGAYALVGMGAVFAGATHASMTAVIIMFEMTGDYKIILPLMLSVVTATLLSGRLLRQETIYTLKLTRRGVRLQRGRDVDILESVRVEEAMSEPIPVTPETSLEELTDLFLRTNRHGFPVLDQQNRLIGIISITDVRNATTDSGSGPLRAGDLMTRSVVTVFPDDTLGEALRRMAPRDLSRLPVVSRHDPQHLVGIVRRNDVVSAYNLALTRKTGGKLQMTASLRTTPSVEVTEFELPDGSTCIGRTVKEMGRRLPADSLLISIRRATGEVVLPHGSTRFHRGDTITACARRGQLSELRRCFGLTESFRD